MPFAGQAVWKREGNGVNGDLEMVGELAAIPTIFLIWSRFYSFFLSFPKSFSMISFGQGLIH
ncbi:hypothetical protein BCY86_05245 [Pajaroellobacter abortibovis]|uniref:Uncharacterized protein n=1 Tax=Pajaroellobacter abortibovis TaxID=1882918 RepID=A0A1L6MX97_9BACT|nr:hypothetical protein BCY86_05245 [Pajaroellobacter abortibovis]